VIHKIKAMYDQGRGGSIREIARTLKISRSAVRNYLALDEASIDAKLSAVKVQRKLEEKVGPLEAASRSLRPYIRALRDFLSSPIFSDLLPDFGYTRGPDDVFHRRKIERT
jgi:hypothetical protein